MKHSTIVANTPDFDATPFLPLLQSTALLIAADGGGDALFKVGQVPHLIVGDLDSITPAALAALIRGGSEVRRFRTDKDETDLELALLAAVERGATHIDILGALGGRWDQTLSNVALLALPELHDCHVRLLDRGQEAFLVHGYANISGTVGDTVSLIPLGGSALGITTRGLHYPLTDATLRFEHSRGVSNVIDSLPAEVTLRAGMLLIVRQGANL